MSLRGFAVPPSRVAPTAAQGPPSCSPGSRMGSSMGLRRKRPADHLLHKLRLRESFGVVRSRRMPTRRTRAPQTKLFTRLPVRLAFCLKDAVPMSAIEAGHVFLGFSKCGQFLLSYTQTTADFDMLGLGESVNYQYRLHWWLFVPYRRAKKVSEVLLFSDDGVPGAGTGGLRMAFCQWPNDPTKVVVYGCTAGDGINAAPMDPSSGAPFSSPSSNSGVEASPSAASATGAADCGTPSPISCYLTVTAVPSLAGCKDCVRVAASYGEEDVAEAWNSCVRLSCLEHGVTVHTAFDLVTPYPEFNPKVSLKRDGTVVVNTGNLLHSFSVQLETLGSGAQDQELGCPQHQDDQQHQQPLNPMMLAIISKPASPPHSTSSSLFPSRIWAELSVATELGLFSPPVPLPLCSPNFQSPSPYNPAASVASDSETTDCESDCGAHTRNGSNGGVRKKKTYHVKNQERLEKVSEFVEQLQSPPDRISQRRRLLRFHDLDQPSPASGTGSTTATATNRRMAAEKAYELTDDDLFDEGAGVREKLSVFRRKRLADRTYEFKEDDEDAENVTPLSKLRMQRSVDESDDQEPAFMPMPSTSSKSPLRPPTSSECEVSILKAIDNQNNAAISTAESGGIGGCEVDADVSGLVVDTMPGLLSPGGMVKKDASSSSAGVAAAVSACSPRPGGSSGQQQQMEQPPPPPRFHAKFTRRFIELDDEAVTVITDIEDEDQHNHATMATTGFHTVLPLSVHGSGYQSMAMISNAKASRLTGSRRCVKVQQRSVDMELLCHYMAQKLCAAAGKKYWFCNDYDVEMVDFDPDSGEVVCAAVVLVLATVVTKRVSQHQRYSISSLHRHQYQASFRFSWNVDTAQCSVIDSEPLTDLSHASNAIAANAAAAAAAGGVWHPAKGVAAVMKQACYGPTAPSFALPTSGPGSVKCLSNEAVIRGASLKSIVDSEHLVAIIQDNLE